MRILITLFLAATMFAQTGNVYISSTAEASEAKAFYEKITLAKEALDNASRQFKMFKDGVKKAHGLSKNDEIEFNSEFTTFQKTATSGSGYVTHCADVTGCVSCRITDYGGTPCCCTIGY
jgi:hypothetical protein